MATVPTPGSAWRTSSVRIVTCWPGRAPVTSWQELRDEARAVVSARLPGGDPRRGRLRPRDAGSAQVHGEGFADLEKYRGAGRSFAMGLADFIKVYRFLRGIRYPATKQQLMDQALSNQADEEALSSLRKMPEGEYSGLDEVSRVIAEK